VPSRSGRFLRSPPGSGGTFPPIQIHSAVSLTSASAISTTRASASRNSSGVALAASSSTLSVGRPSSAIANFANGNRSFHCSSRRYAARSPSPSGGARCAHTTSAPPWRASWIRLTRRPRRTLPSSSRSQTVASSRRCGAVLLIPYEVSSAGISVTLSTGCAQSAGQAPPGRYCWMQTYLPPESMER
jgi:hypothetical protein